MLKAYTKDKQLTSKEILPSVWDNKELLQKEMHRLLLRTLNANWLDNPILQKKIEKLSFLLAGYSPADIRINS